MLLDCEMRDEMKFVLAPDSFKGTMSASVVASTMAAGVRDVIPDAECVEVPMADGGEGTTQSLVDALGGVLRHANVNDALGRKRMATYGWIESERLAVVEIAESAGIEHLSPNELDPRKANTAGVGQLLKHIRDLSPRRVIVGLGGSATNDGGWGMANELGVHVYDSTGRELPARPLALTDATKIDVSGLDPCWRDIDIVLACDVDNPLVGDQGASAVFGAQKGVKPEDVQIFDEALSRWGERLDEISGAPVSNMRGAGAAGGLGAAFMGLLGARSQRGVELVIDAVGLNDKITGADYVFTGEGAMDFQTKFGKTPWGVMLAAKTQGVATIAFTGNLGFDGESLQEDGFDAIVPTVRVVSSLEEALRNAQSSLYESVRMVCRIIATNRVTDRDE